MSTAQLSPGTVVDGKVTIGAATWARVGAQSYEATDERGQAVTLTAYAPGCFSSGLVLERSLRELRQLQSLQSVRVAAVLACGKLPDGGIYEVDAPLPGERLDAIMARGPLPGPEAAGIIEQVGEGLLEAQKAGVIHRNLGPRVVFVGPAGAVVTGFSVGEPHGDKSFGPLDTIAPEQVEGKVVDQRTLIYNLAALMHMLVTGAPLFAGDAATQLSQHLGGEIPEDAHARLRRALGKDPRMRPMMLKQFLSELRAIGGGAALAPVAPSSKGQAPPLPGSNLATPGGAAKPAAGAPSSRGWTMFMQGEGEAAPAAGAAPAAASDPPAKPKTRGWTMFMEGADEPPPEKAAEEKAAPKPSTRGWTMFMEDDEGQAPPAAEAESPLETPSAALGAEGAQPKTRGWTMFMEGVEGEDAAPAAADAPASQPAAAPPPVGGPAAKPSTRGWTMFMKADEESAAEAVALAEPAASPPSAAAPVAPAAAATATTPKSRGWTMFTEASDDESEPATLAMQVPKAPESEQATLAVQVPRPAVEAAAPPEPTTTASSTSGGKGRKGDADAPSKKRGWTMFMEKPLADAKAKEDPLGGVVPASGESNAKGWTVFSPVADVHAEPSLEPTSVAEEAPLAQGLGPAMATAAIDAAMGSASGQTHVATDDAGVRAQAAADSERLRAKTLIVTGPPEPAGGRPTTLVTPPDASPAVQPRTTTMVSPEPPRGAVAEPISAGISGPLSTGFSGPISTGMPMPVTGSHALVPTKKSSPVGLIIVGVVIVAAVIVGAIVVLN